MIRIYFLAICSLLSLNISCIQNSVKESNNKYYLMVKDSINNHVKELLLSDVADNIDIIPLETTKNSVFKRIFSFAIGDSDLFICSYTKVQHFNLKNGKFLGYIGTLGNGPGDFNYCTGIGINDGDRLIYVFSGEMAQNEVKCYTYEGEFINLKRLAPVGSYTIGGWSKGFYRGYTMLDNMHVLRRMLPVQDGTKDIWQLRFFDTSGNKIATYSDPANLSNINRMNDNQPDSQGFDISEIPGFWSADSPILNQYYNHINILFDSNDTIYRYNKKNNLLHPQYILNCGIRPGIDEIRKEGKRKKYFEYIFVNNVLETKDYLFLVTEKDDIGYLVSVDKNTGSIKSIQKEGEIVETWAKTFTREAPPPGFTNDLCGGLPFFPCFHNENKWVALYDPSDLLEKINIDELKKTKVLFPTKRDELINVLRDLNEDDNLVLMVVNLK